MRNPALLAIAAIVGFAAFQAAAQMNDPPSLPPGTTHWTFQVDGVVTEMNVPPGTATNTVAQISRSPGQLKRYIVSLKRSLKDPLDVDPDLDPSVIPEDVIAEFNLLPTHIYHYAIKGFAAFMDDVTAEVLRRDPRILEVGEDCGIQLIGGPPAPYGVQRIGADQFPVAQIGYAAPVPLMYGGHVVHVAVVDTGIQLDHPDLNVSPYDANLDPDSTNCSYDLSNSGNYGDDWNGHGTHVAGIIGGMGLVVNETIPGEIKMSMFGAWPRASASARCRFLAKILRVGRTSSGPWITYRNSRRRLISQILVS